MIIGEFKKKAIELILEKHFVFIVFLSKQNKMLKPNPSFSMYDATGRLVFHSIGHSFDISTLSEGVYTYEIQVGTIYHKGKHIKY